MEMVSETETDIHIEEGQEEEEEQTRRLSPSPYQAVEKRRVGFA